jgi:hypothetical protein
LFLGFRRGMPSHERLMIGFRLLLGRRLLLERLRRRPGQLVPDFRRLTLDKSIFSFVSSIAFFSALERLQGQDIVLVGEESDLSTHRSALGKASLSLDLVPA